MKSREYRSVLIIENESNPDEYISSYISQKVNSPHWDIDFLTNLSRQSKKDIQQKLSENDTYLFSSTFHNREQNDLILKMIAEQEHPKDIFIHYLSRDLHFGLRKVIPDGFNPTTNGFKNHTIYGIHRETKEVPTEEYTFFKKLVHYFDTIEYYWNDEYKGYFPERPNCFFNDNLNTVYKYKPFWVTRDSDIKEN